MLRRDYIIRMIEEFFRALATIRSLKNQREWREAADAIEEQCKVLIGAGTAAVATLSDTELLARMLQGEPTQMLHQKTVLLSALLKEAGDVAKMEGNAARASDCYLRGLHLLLRALAEGEPFEQPDLIPTIDVFVLALEDLPVSITLPTHALLMQHYERSGQFGKAEDELYAMLQVEPGNLGIVTFGIDFYQRLHGQSEEILIAGNLPPSEVEAGLEELTAIAKRLARC